MSRDFTYYGAMIDNNTIHDRHDDILHCLLVGMLIFTASCSCVTGILSEFGLSVNYPLIIMILFVSSMFLSLIHLSRFLYIAGYFSFLFIFAYSLLSMRSYANSGYQALLNIITKAYSDHYLLSSVREYTEIISDRYLTLTTVSIFIGVFLVLLLNVGIFNDMFFFTTFNLTFWPLQLGIFIGRYPSYISLALLFFSYFSVYFLRHSGHYHFVQPPTRHKPREYVFDYDDPKGRNIIFHKSNARTMLALCIFALAASLSFSVFCSLSVTTSEEEALVNRSAAKAQLDEHVKILTQTGIAGMFNRYSAKGGISGGKLGGVRSVAPDYDTDLEVTFVPYSFETLYLHAFTGWQYTGSRWIPPSEASGYKVYMPDSVGPASETAISAERVLSESVTLKKMMDRDLIDKNSARMTIKNIDADTSYIYMPYFPAAIPGKVMTGRYSTLSGFSAPDSEETYEFTPYFSGMQSGLYKYAPAVTYLASDEYNETVNDYETEIYNNYLQIPDNIRDELMSYHEAIGTADNPLKQTAMIYSFFLKNYAYDMAPGATPMGRDFVTYFLGEQKRGYCAHFASAGAMLLRSYNIPARYAEGYVITTSGVAETGSVVDGDPSYYFTGNNSLGQSSVVKTEVTDGDAHAWVEIYISGFGWFPVEFTVPATDDGRASYGDFLSALSRLFAPADNTEATDPDSTDENDNGTDTARRLFRLKSAPVFVVFIAVLVILMLVVPAKKLISRILAYAAQRRQYLSGDHSASVIYRYSAAARRLGKIFKQPAADTVNDNFLLLERLLANQDKRSQRLTKLLKSSGMTLDDMRLLTLTCFYAEKNISRSEADLLIRFYKKLR